MQIRRDGKRQIHLQMCPACKAAGFAFKCKIRRRKFDTCGYSFVLLNFFVFFPWSRQIGGIKLILFHIFCNRIYCIGSFKRRRRDFC